MALRPGMIVSNEPGYYKTGAYGIRIESLVVVAPLPTPSGGEVTLYGFETLTLAPIDRRWSTPRSSPRRRSPGWTRTTRAVREAIAPKVDADDRGVAGGATPPACARSAWVRRAGLAASARSGRRCAARRALSRVPSSARAPGRSGT